MAVLKKNQHLWIFGLSISNHGVLFFLLFTLHGLPYVTAQFRAVPPGPLQDNEFYTQRPTFNPKMAIVMVVLISVFFLMGYCSVYIRQCYQRRSPRSDGEPYAVFLRGTNYRSRRITRGLDASVINTFPTFLYSAVKGLKISKGSLECAVCLNEFEDDETLRLIPKCNHVFHTDCIDAWLASHQTCPVCRADLVPQPGEIASSIIQVFDTDNGSGESEWRSNDHEGISQVDDSRDVESQEVNLMNQNRLPRKSKSTGWRLAGLFPRSHSTGHSLVQPGENCERFTLRLPEEVRNELMNSNLTRSKSCVVFPRERSTRRGFRSGSGRIGRLNYERFNRSTRSGRWGFRIPNVCDEVTCNPPDSQDRSHNNDGDRSFERLPPVQSTV